MKTLLKFLIFILLILCTIFIGYSIFYYLQRDQKTIIQKNEVQISFLFFEKIPYTLNLPQQERLIELVNRNLKPQKLSSSSNIEEDLFFELHFFDSSKMKLIPYKSGEQQWLRIISDKISMDYQADAIFYEYIDSVKISIKK